MEQEHRPSLLDRELAYHEKLYGGFAQVHFARPAVRALRAHMVRRIIRHTGAQPGWRVLSLGCGIGDTELLLAPHVRELAGIDLSPTAIAQARHDASAAAVGNAEFLEGTLETAPLGGRKFDLVFAIFFLHHLPDDAMAALPGRLRSVLAPGGTFYSLDPSRRRLSGAVGQALFPTLMRKYQSPDERQLDPAATRDVFERAGFRSRTSFYDFLSSPLAGLLPGWRAGYAAARALDELLIRMPGLREFGSNFELVATIE